MSRTFMLGSAATLALVATAPASAQGARTTVVPYIELGQVLDADLKGGDVVTYTSIAAGIDAAIEGPRASAQISYRYERRIGWDDDIGDTDVHTGLARIGARVTPSLSLNAGALATRTRADIRGDAPGLLIGDTGNTAQLYSLFAGPAFATQAGAWNLAANYTIGYTKVETPTANLIATGLPRLDYYDDSVGHVAGVSAGFAPGTLLPVGLTASGGYERETASQLSQRYEGWFGRGDALLPVSPYFALAAGVGYERIETSQRDALVDAGGAAVVDGNGRFVTDPASPRRIAYRTDGVYYDAGVVWRPNRRTSVEGRVGKRYGSTSYTGSLTYQASRDVGIAVGVYDGIQTFGRQLRSGLSQLPTGFVAARDGLSQQYNGCVFSTSGTTPGGCLNDVFQSVSTASYRARGVDGVVSVQRGLNTYGFGAGYANRELHAPDRTPGIVLYGLNDESWYGQLFYARSLTPNSGIDANAFFNYYTSELGGSVDIASYGATASYYRNFGRLGTTASVGIYSFKVGDLESALSAQALLGARYQF